MKNFLIDNPFGLRRKDKKTWDQIDGYKCVVVTDENRISIQKAVLDNMKCLLSVNGAAFVIIWFFDGGVSHGYYLNAFADMSLISSRDDYLLYEIKNISDVEQILFYWGEYDHLEIIFSKNESNWRKYARENFYNGYREYRKDIIVRILSSNAIIGDTGDGEEVEFILSNAVFELLFSEIES